MRHTWNGILTAVEASEGAMGERNGGDDLEAHDEREG